jgi:hypothetical protein
MINVIFVRSELTLNNFVIIAYGTDHQVAYSSLIYGARPFAWLRQDPSRSPVSLFRKLTQIDFARAGHFHTLKSRTRSWIFEN